MRDSLSYPEDLSLQLSVRTLRASFLTVNRPTSSYFLNDVHIGYTKSPVKQFRP